jgi:hypothetical protein
MTKPERGQPILVTIGERVLELRYPLGALKELDRNHGISLLKGSGAAEMFADPEKLSAMVYYGLKTRQPDVTPQWVDDNVDASMLLNLAPLLVYATTGRWPKMLNLDEDDEDGDETENPLLPATLSTGSQSGPSDATTSAAATLNSGH